MSKVSLLLVTRAYSQDFRLAHCVPHCNTKQQRVREKILFPTLIILL